MWIPICMVAALVLVASGQDFVNQAPRCSLDGTCPEFPDPCLPGEEAAVTGCIPTYCDTDPSEGCVDRPVLPDDQPDVFPPCTRYCMITSCSEFEIVTTTYQCYQVNVDLQTRDWSSLWSWLMGWRNGEHSQSTCYRQSRRCKSHEQSQVCCEFHLPEPHPRPDPRPYPPPSHGHGQPRHRPLFPSLPWNPRPLPPGGSDPLNPNQPQHPNGPGNPEGPVEPNDPNFPGEPGNPGEPNDPNFPGEPGNPGDPNDPNFPGESGNPTEPQDPSFP